MNKYAFLAAFAAVPAMVAPASAQAAQQVTASQYVETQLAILKGATELLTLEGIADAPAEVAAGLNQLAQMTAALASLKSTINTSELEAAEAEVRNDPETHMVGQAFIAAVSHVSANNFYNCEQLAIAVQTLSAAMEQL